MLEAPLRSYGVVNGSENVSLWKHRAELQKDALSAAQIEQEVVNQRNAKVLCYGSFVHRPTNITSTDCAKWNAAARGQ
jgi:hypothetical protein